MTKGQSGPSSTAKAFQIWNAIRSWDHRQLRLVLGLLLAILSLASFARPAHATLIFTLNSTSCANCGSSPWGTVSVTQDASGPKAIDFTITLNAPFQFHQTHNSQHPVFAVNLDVLNVSFSNFKLNNVVTPKVTSAGPSGSVPNYGAFKYTLSASSNLAGVLTFTASVANGTLKPTDVVTNGKAYMAADIIDLMTKGTGNIAAVYPPVHTPEPLGLSLLVVGLAGVGIARRSRSRRR